MFDFNTVEAEQRLFFFLFVVIAIVYRRPLLITETAGFEM
jgi:hypothetical protein